MRFGQKWLIWGKMLIGIYVYHGIPSQCKVQPGSSSCKFHQKLSVFLCTCIYVFKTFCYSSSHLETLGKWAVIWVEVSWKQWPKRTFLNCLCSFSTVPLSQGWGCIYPANLSSFLVVEMWTVESKSRMPWSRAQTAFVIIGAAALGESLCDGTSWDKHKQHSSFGFCLSLLVLLFGAFSSLTAAAEGGVQESARRSYSRALNSLVLLH